MNIEDLRLFVKRQSPPHRADMIKALGLSPIEFERWEAKKHDYDNDVIVALVDWARGRYGFSQVTGKWERDPVRSRDPLSLQVKAAPALGNPNTFTAGQGHTLGQTIAGKGAPKGTSKAELQRIKEREEEEAKKKLTMAAKLKQAFKPSEVKPLYPAGHARSA